MRVLRTFHNIVTAQDLSFEEKTQALLTFGLKVFNLDIGIISQVKASTYTVINVVCPNQEISAGDSFPFIDTYCIHTLTSKIALAFHHAGESDIASHPCYQNFKLESYIGAPILVDGEVFGTVNFSSAKPSLPFSELHIDYIELFAQWFGSEMARENSLKFLLKKTETLRKLEQAANIGSWEVDVINNTVSWSENTRALHEVDDDYVPELESAINFYPAGKNRDAINAAVETSIKTGKPWDLEVEFCSIRGKRIWVSAQGSAEFENGECVRLFGTIQDISKEVSMRQTLQAQKDNAEFLLNERTQLIAKISHEIRTPLNGIIGMLISAIDSETNPKLAQKLKVALRSSDILLSIVNDVLDFSKINHGELSLEPINFELRRAFVDVISLFTPAAENKSIKLIAQLNIENHTIAYFDVTRLTQIVANLISNAIKFTERGTVKLTVDTRPKDAFIHTHICVEDSGIGMSSNTKKVLFKPFSQATTKYGGTGLGLSIIKELVDMMGGTIDVISEPKSGSKFTINLILPKGQKDAEQTLAHYTADTTNLDASVLKVLVVDDNEINRLVLASSLEKYKISPDFAIDGIDAIHKCQEHTYDLIFMDCVMPEMSGQQATQVIHQKKLVPSHTLIAAITANTSPTDKLACRQAGMDVFLTKPIQPEMIKATIVKALKQCPRAC